MGQAASVAAPEAPLALVEAIDRDGLVRQAWRVERWPVSIGRALDNTVVLSDPHVAAHHATLDLVDGAEGAPAQIVVSAGDLGRRRRDPERRRRRSRASCCRHDAAHRR